MGAVSCMKHLGLLGIHIIVIRSGDGVLVTIPKRIQKFIMAAGAGFIPLPDRCLKRSVCRQVTVIRKQLAIRVVQQLGSWVAPADFFAGNRCFEREPVSPKHH